MSDYIVDKTTSSGNRGSHFNAGTDYIYYVNETEAKIYRQPINPATVIAQQIPRNITANTSLNLNTIGATDLKWTGTAGSLQALAGAKILKFTTQTSLDQITPNNLTELDWASATTQISENGQSTVGVCYAVRIPANTDYHYAKFRIFKDGTATKVEWICYITSTSPVFLYQIDAAAYPAPRDIVVNADDSEIYISGGGANGYILLIPRVNSGSFPVYDSNAQVINADPLQNPQQMVIYGNTIYVAAADGVFAVDMVTHYQSQVISGITNPVGLLIKDQATTRTAYVSDALGNVYSVDITGFNLPSFNDDGSISGQSSEIIVVSSPTDVLALGGPSGFLTWADGTHTAFYAALPTLNLVKRVDLIANTVYAEVATNTMGPWSVEVFDENDLTVICDTGIGDIKRGISIDANTPLALGIGLIPFNLINKSVDNPPVPDPNDGKANTSSVPGYYFSTYPNLAFGGSLSVLINHGLAYTAGARFYKVSMTKVNTDGTAGQLRAITNAFMDVRWNAALNQPRFEGVSTGTQDGYYPVRIPTDLWYNMFLGTIFSTSTSDNGHNRLKIDFYNVNKVLIPGGSFTRLIYIDNTMPSGQLFDMRRGSDTVPPSADDYQSPSACGTLVYDTKNDLIEFDLMASRPDGLGTYVLSFARGGAVLFSVVGNVTSTPTLMTVKEKSVNTPLRIGHLVGNCNVANVSVTLNVPARAINGYGWVNLSSYSNKSFTLVKGPESPHEPWP